MGRFIGGGPERSRSRDPGGAPCNGNSEVVCLPERDGEFPPVFCARPEPLRFMYWKSPRDAPRAFLCRFESLREEAPPLGENGQRCCGLKAPMVLIRSSKSSRETSVCPLIFDR